MTFPSEAAMTPREQTLEHECARLTEELALALARAGAIASSEFRCSGTHTPGPWKVTFGREENSIQVWAGLEIVADCKKSKSIGFPAKKANANLIAAAPELLGACLAMIEWDDRENDHAVSFEDRMNLCREAFEKARVAIYKATGATHD